MAITTKNARRRNNQGFCEPCRVWFDTVRKVPVRDWQDEDDAEPMRFVGISGYTGDAEFTTAENSSVAGAILIDSDLINTNLITEASILW